MLEAGGALDRRFEAIIFDWDGTGIPDRHSNADSLRDLIEQLCASAMDIAIVSGTNLGNVDAQLGARPSGPGRLHLLLNRGSEIFAVGRSGTRSLHRRIATKQEKAALDRAARSIIERLAEKGLEATIISQRLNRRKIDLIPLPEWSDPPKAQIAGLLKAVNQRLKKHGFESLEELVRLAYSVAVKAGLPDPRVTTDAKHIEVGLTDKSDSARWFMADLWARGVDSSLVLVAGDELGFLGGVPGSDWAMAREAASATVLSVGVEPEGVPDGVVWRRGGPAVFLDVLQDQLRRRLEREVPRTAPSPKWALRVEELDSSEKKERAHEVRLTIADGRLGTNGAPFARHPTATPYVLVSGTYAGQGQEEELLHAPLWNQLPIDIPPTGRLVRELDLRTGVLHQELQADGQSWRALQFSSLDRPGVVAFRLEGPLGSVPVTPSLAEPGNGVPVDQGETEDYIWMRAGSGAGAVVAAARNLTTDSSDRSRLERIAVYERPSGRRPGAIRRVKNLTSDAYDKMLARHRAAWARRWRESGIDIEGDPELDRAVQFALFHLMASAGDRGEAAVGPRGLTGPTYKGHVMWDSDVFVLPVLAATHPRAARAMLEYRMKRLPAARAAAQALERAGSRFPWESAQRGDEVTVTHVHDSKGQTVAIKTGLLEEHIVADVAWAAKCYVDWTGDQDFATGPGARLLGDTARYWASRIRRDRAGVGHIYGVIGPDEYHDAVDDNAYTNVMARWNLREAAAAVASGMSEAGSSDESHHWMALADCLRDGYDPNTGIYEQFAGFYGLEPLIIRDLFPSRPIAADARLGMKRVAGAQVLKQADVLMLHHLVPDQVATGSLRPNLDFYEPRTAHGSSLSPGVHAAVLARAGEVERALEALRLTARMDLDDLMGSTGGGIHLATMGSLWQALVFGFAGILPSGGALMIDPHLPAAWNRLVLRLRFQGVPLTVSIEPGRVRLEAGGRVKVRVQAGSPQEVGPGMSELPL
jgi:hypothetical protein